MKNFNLSRVSSQISGKLILPLAKSLRIICSKFIQLEFKARTKPVGSIVLSLLAKNEFRKNEFCQKYSDRGYLF